MIKRGKYQHYKGNFYEVIDIAKHSETEEWHVIYRPDYGERGLWIRPLAMFTENVVVGDKATPRFRYVGQE